MPKQAEAKRDGAINQQIYNSNQFKHGKSRINLSRLQNFAISALGDSLVHRQ